ncbi:MAG: cation diffusion facilitator family transporter [Bdellovibrionales bacterium]
MAGGEHSTRVILVAFAANLGIAAAKFVGAVMTGSAALLAEGIHSLVDCSNQLLLLLGARRSARPPDEQHPLGYGREAFFWSFIVAILLFSLGGLFAIYEGVHKLGQTEEVQAPLIGLLILLVSVGLEGYSFRVCLNEVRQQPRFAGYLKWFKSTKNSELLVIFAEDLAALAGLTIALLALLLAWLTGNPMWDSIGSILVGLLLVIVAIFLAVEIKSFLVGEAADEDLKRAVEAEVREAFPTGRLLRYIAIQVGSHSVLLSCKVHPGELTDLKSAIHRVNQMERKIKELHSSVTWQFIELDLSD